MGTKSQVFCQVDRTMRIGVTNLKSGCGKSTFAVNLACELADISVTAIDRWQGNRRVVLVDADANGTAMRYWSGGRLPVSAEYMPLDGSANVRHWMDRVREMAVDDVVVDAPSHLDVVTKAIMLVSDLIIVPVSAGDPASASPTIEMVKEVRASRSDGGPRCLLVPARLEGAADGRNGFATTLREFGETVGPGIRQSSAFADAFQAGQWIGEFAPNGDAHKDIKALAENVRSLGLAVAATENDKTTARRPGGGNNTMEPDLNCTILIVDDDANLLTLVSGLLAKSYNVLTACNGAVALRQSRDFKGEIRLLLSDFQMPGMSGIELATAMTLDRPGIKVLLMSGFTEGMLVLNEGWHFLPKPFVASQLRALVAGLLYPDKISRFVK